MARRRVLQPSTTAAPAVLAAPVAVVAVASLLLIAFASRFSDFVTDDAFITFRYAHNLLNGHGMVFNPGERVEGYTNFLWVLCSSVALFVGIDPETAARALSLLAWLALLVAVVRFGPRPPASMVAIAAGPLLLALHPAVSVWAMSGLEEPLFVCLMLWGICLTLKGAEDGRPAVAGAALLAGAALTRPEGAGVAAMTALATACAYRRQIRYAAWLPWAAMFLALFVPYFIWRWSYYGYPVPNSFYAKVGSTGAQVLRGLRYVHESLWVTGYWWLVPAALALTAARRRFVAVIAALFVWWLLVVAVLGGDNQPMYRFFLPPLALLGLLVSWGVACSIERLSLRGPRLAVAVVPLLAAFAYTTLPGFRGPQLAFVRQHRREVDAWRQIGRWFHDNSRAGESIAVLPAGAIPYFAELPAIDMLGLNDLHIGHRQMPDMGSGPVGHEKYDVDYVLQRAPSYILVGVYGLSPDPLPANRMITPYYAAERLLLQHPQFLAHYRAAVASVPGGRFVYFVRVVP